MSNQIKTAILIVGHLRTAKFTLASLKRHLFKKIYADIFVATYENSDCYENRWWRGVNKNIQKTKKSIVKKFYNPKKVSIKKENPIRPWPLDKHLKYRSGYLLNMLHNFLSCYNLSKQFGQYERYICIRPDLQLFSDINFNEVCDKEYTYFPRNDYFTRRGSICDTWIICNPSYFKILNKYKQEIIPKLLSCNKNVLHQEDHLHKFIVFNKIKIKLSKTKWGLRRTSKKCTIWDQKMPCYLGAFNRIVRACLVKKFELLNSFLFGDKITILKIGNEKNLPKTLRNTFKRKNPNKQKTFQHWLPRFRAGKYFFEIFIKKVKGNS